jgi:hypothetical protein
MYVKEKGKKKGDNKRRVLKRKEYFRNKFNKKE